MLIQAQNLSRSFGEIRAVDGVSFEVAKGDVLGFLGPNGAGKSTTMKMLTGFLTPSGGRALIGDYDPVSHPREAKRLLGYLPENAPLYEEMTVKDFLDFIARVRELSPQLLKASIDRVVSLTRIENVLRQRIETLSKGYKRRVGLAQALLHDPQVLILDEPTDGLDPNQKHDVRTVISDMAKEKCIVLSTHILEEVDAVCNRVIIISKGKLVVDSTPDKLRRQSPHFGAITLEVSDEGPGVRDILAGVAGVASVAVQSGENGKKRYTVIPLPNREISSPLLKEIEVRHWNVGSFFVDNGQLDEVFRTITQNR